jgi:hypothetical protein
MPGKNQNSSVNQETNFKILFMAQKSRNKFISTKTKGYFYSYSWSLVSQCWSSGGPAERSQEIFYHTRKSKCQY